MQIAATVAASNVNQTMALFTAPEILLDSNTAITLATSVTSYVTSITYAEIPIEGSGVPVVVQ